MHDKCTSKTRGNSQLGLNKWWVIVITSWQPLNNHSVFNVWDNHFVITNHQYFNHNFPRPSIFIFWFHFKEWDWFLINLWVKVWLIVSGTIRTGSGSNYDWWKVSIWEQEEILLWTVTILSKCINRVLNVEYIWNDQIKTYLHKIELISSKMCDTNVLEIFFRQNPSHSRPNCTCTVKNYHHLV